MRPVHDAILIEAPLDVLDAHVARAQELMAEASRAVLGGFTTRTDAKIVRYPERYEDPRGAKMWADVMALIDEVEGVQHAELQLRRLLGTTRIAWENFDRAWVNVG